VVYKVVLVHNDEGCSISCPALPSCFSQSETAEEALENIQDAIYEYLEAATDVTGTKSENLEVSFREVEVA